MRDLIQIIRTSVRAAAEKDEVVNVDEYCSKFAGMRPDLDRRAIQDAVLEAVAAYGGGASWTKGSEPTSRGE